MAIKNRSAVAIIRQNRILLIKRIKDGNSYYILPGGGIEPGETPVQTAYREVKEELGIEVEILKKLTEFENRGQIEYYYLVKNFSGEIKAIGDSPFNANIKDDALWVEMDRLNKINLLPEKIKIYLMDYYKNIKG
jgi:mutator protein MutT